MQSLRFDGSCCWFECFLIKPGLNMPKNILKAFTKEKTTQILSLEALLYALEGWFFCGAFCSFLEFDSAWWLYYIPLLHWKGDILQIIMCVCVFVWTFHFQVEAVKEMLYQLEETFLKKKALRATKQQKTKEKKALKKLSLGSPTVPPQGQPNAVAYPQPSHPISEHLPPPHKHLSSAKK